MDNKKNLHDWITKIIESCRDDFHFEGVDRIIELFNDRHKDEELYVDLKLKRSEKWNEIHVIIAPHLNK